MRRPLFYCTGNQSQLRPVYIPKPMYEKTDVNGRTNCNCICWLYEKHRFKSENKHYSCCMHRNKNIFVGCLTCYTIRLCYLRLPQRREYKWSRPTDYLSAGVQRQDTNTFCSFYWPDAEKRNAYFRSKSSYHMLDRCWCNQQLKQNS